MDYQFTAKMETELDDIAEGTLNSITNNVIAIAKTPSVKNEMRSN